MMLASARTRPVLLPAAGLILTALFLIFALPLENDPYRCNALLREGSWLDSPDADGNRMPFAEWQPRGCMMRKYTRADIHRCVDGRPMLFSGDYSTSEVFWAIARILDKEKADILRAETSFKETIDTEFDNLRLINIWNPDLKTGSASPNLTEHLQLLQNERKAAVPVRRQHSAALTLLGGGSWFANASDGAGPDKFRHALDPLTKMLYNENGTCLGLDSMDPLDGVGNQVFIAPVAQPVFDQVSEDAKVHFSIRRRDIEALNDLLADVEVERDINVPWSFLALTHGQHLAITDRNSSGLHVLEAIAEAKANILFNLRCNARLDAMDGYPYNHNCCSDYGGSSPSQELVVALAAIFTLICFACRLVDAWRGRSEPRKLFNSHTAMFAVALLACYLADRTQFLAKGSKHFGWIDFYFLSCVAVAVGMAFRGKKSPVRSTLPAPSRPLAENQPLSRDQTEEWKGWMQVFVLIYRWTGPTESLGLHIGFRLVAAAYLFQTSYGHTTYFLTTRDFSAKRFVSVVLRLNLLNWFLSYVMQTEYLTYYFVPMVTFWFTTVYIIMAIYPKGNTNLVILMTKMSLSLLLYVLFMSTGPVPGWLYDRFEDVSQVDWDLREWYFHLALDAPVAYAGMLVAFASHAGYLGSLHKSFLRGFVGFAAIALYWFICLSTLDAKMYDKLHPMVSLVPMGAYIVLRNSSSFALSHISRPFAWLGRHTLEMYILQHHLFLAADGKGLLMLDFLIGNGSFLDRWRQIAVLLPAFLWICWRVNQATSVLVCVLTQQDEDYGYKHLELEKSETTGSIWGCYLKLLAIAQLVTTKRFWRNDAGIRLVLILGVLAILNRMG